MSSLEDRKKELELQLELVNKEIDKESIPKVKDYIDWTPVINIAKEMIDEMSEGDYYDCRDDEHFLYEAVMTSMYGDDVFEWINDLEL